jgi:hypothetical protein
MSENLRAGYAQRVITPSLQPPVYLAGFGQNRVAQGVHDDLYARVLALEMGETRLAWVALDIIGLPRHHCRAIQSRLNAQFPGLHTIIACTHTHHGPDTIGLWGPNPTTQGVNFEYLDGLKNSIVESVDEAFGQLKTAAMRAAVITVAGVAKNARDPHVLDEELTCLQFCGAENQVIATLLIFPCHPEVLWDGNPQITSDYVHTLRTHVEAETNAPSLFMAGALGGMMTPDVINHDFEESAAMGEVLARAALNILSRTTTTPVNRLSHQTREFAVPMSSFLFEEAIKIGLLPDVTNEHNEVITEANLIKIGDMWIATVPGELLPKLGLSLKDQLRAAGASVAAVVGLANDEIGYILPEDEYIYPDNPFDPGAHYEETMSLGPETAPRLFATFNLLLTAEGVNRP